MSAIPLSEAEVVRRIKLHIRDKHGSQHEFAKSMQVSDAYVSQVLGGKRHMPAEWLRLIGVARVIEVKYLGGVA